MLGYAINAHPLNSVNPAVSQWWNQLKIKMCPIHSSISSYKMPQNIHLSWPKWGMEGCKAVAVILKYASGYFLNTNIRI